MKRKVGRSFISIIIALMIAATALPAYAYEESNPPRIPDQTEEIVLQADEASDTLEIIGKFTEALSKFYENTSEMSKISAFLTRFGGVVEGAGGVIGILQMAGIIKDPTEEMLAEILTEVKNIQEKLEAMDKKLDDLNTQLIGVAASIEEKDRSNKAASMLKNWDDFNRDYCETLDTYIEEYQAKVVVGIQDWWKNEEKDGVRVIYHMIDNAPQLTYSSSDYSAVLETADNGESIDQDCSFKVPAEYIPDTIALGTFDVNKYQSLFTGAMAAKFIEAANGEKLDANENFYAAWKELDDTAKTEKANAYAADILNSQIYVTACNVMSASHEWVTDVRAAYRNYNNHILSKNSGINAELNAMYLTHGFEGEIRSDIEEFCDAMIVKAGVYGQFALTCMGQDKLMTIQNRQEVRTMFLNTVNKLSEKKKLAVTGFDNFCYITGTRVDFDTVELSSKMSVTTFGSSTLTGFTKTDWDVTIPNYLNNIYSQVLYDQYKTLNQGTSSFAAYLNKYKTGIAENYDGTIMTKYGGDSDFALNEGISMKAHNRLGNYFEYDGMYKINVDNPSKIENEYFLLHDKVTYDVFDMKDETVKVNQLAAARAFYGENHWYWICDEITALYTNNLKCNYKYKNFYNLVDFNLSRNIDILKLTPCKDLNGGDDEYIDPFYDFDGPVFKEGVSAVAGPVVYDNKTDITDAALKTSTFTYTGKALKPKVDVKAGTETVPASGYTVSYNYNKAVGSGYAIINGKGNYSGTIYKQFDIIPKGTKISKAAKNKTKATVKWKKQASKMTSSRITGYQIRYSTKSSMKNAKKVTVKGYKKTSKQIKGLKKNKKYYFQIRTFIKTRKGTIYSKWSKKKAVK